MSSEETPQAQGPDDAQGGEQREQLSPEQEQMLRQMEEEMARVRVEDLIAQSVVSILNLAARRIVKEDERDLEQARAGIDAVRALADQLDPDSQREIKNALSQIQMLYARAAGETAAGDAPAPSATITPWSVRKSVNVQFPPLGKRSWGFTRKAAPSRRSEAARKAGGSVSTAGGRWPLGPADSPLGTPKAAPRTVSSEKLAPAAAGC